MSIKGAIKRLEGILAKNGGNQSFTFVIPYCRNVDKSERIKTQLISENGLANRTDILVVFVINFATAA
ncbi:MAG TPA: hypothetical protein VIH61_06225 [Waddliaceae bacterium]